MVDADPADPAETAYVEYRWSGGWRHGNSVTKGGVCTRRWRSPLPPPLVGDTMFAQRGGYLSDVEPLDEMESDHDMPQDHYTVASREWHITDQGTVDYLLITAVARTA